MTTDELVAVLGAGIMGAGVAVSCALAGLHVTTLSRHTDRASAAAEQVLAGARRHGLATGDETESAAGRIRHVDSSAGIPPDVTLVLENLPESLALKVEVIRSVLLRARGDVVIATNSSSLSVAAIGRNVGAAELTVGLHFMNPALLMPLVELSTCDATAACAVSRCEQLAIRLGKRIIRVHGDFPGFVWNRLQMIMLREAVQLVRDGVASAEDVDAAVAVGLARRWQYAGPLATARLGGAQTFATVARNLLPVCSDRRDLDDLEDFLPSHLAVTDAGGARQEGLARLLRADRSGARQKDSP